MKIQPKENYKYYVTVGTYHQLDKTKHYQACHATNLPEWKEKGKIFVSFADDGEASILLESGEYLVID